MTATSTSKHRADMAARAAADLRPFRREFSRVSNVRGAIDLVAYWSAIVGLFAFAHWLCHPLGYLFAVIAIAGLQHALINLQHDAWHYLCFRPRRWNDAVAAWFYAYPVGMPYHHERRRHLAHHHLVGTPEDPDWVTYSNAGRVPGAKLIRFLLGRLFGSLLLGIVSSVLLRGRPRVGATGGPERGPSLTAEYGAAILCQFVLLAAFWAAGRWWEYFVLWALPIATFTSLFVSLRGFLEHAHAEDAADKVERLFDFQPTWLERYFVAPCHFYLHALHHAFPTIPHGRLRSAKRHLLSQGYCYPGRDEGTYTAYLVGHLSRLARRQLGTANRDIASDGPPPALPAAEPRS